VPTKHLAMVEIGTCSRGGVLLSAIAPHFPRFFLVYSKIDSVVDEGKCEKIEEPHRHRERLMEVSRKRGT